MTIERIKDHMGFNIHCDFCPSYLEVESEYFSDVVKALKEEGWKFWKNVMDGDKWNHECPLCQEERK